eukprot:850956-Pelagomonas_calceolata.AAC.1
MRNVSKLILCARCLKVESCKWLDGQKLVISVSMMKSKTRNMLSPIATALRCVSCAENTRIFSSLYAEALVGNSEMQTQFEQAIA